MRDALVYGLTGAVVLGTAAVIWLSVRYQTYVNLLRSGKGKRPKKVWKPFWFD